LSLRKLRFNFGQHRFCLNQVGTRRCQLRLKIPFIDFGQEVARFHILTIRYQYSRDRSINPALTGKTEVEIDAIVNREISAALAPFSPADFSDP
jgi:hypothetical protein